MATGGAGEWRRLLTACEQGDFETAERYLISEKCDVNFQHPEIGQTPLIAAVKGNRLDIVKLVVERGNADVNMEAEIFSEGSPAHIAREKGFKEIEDYLVSKGAKYIENEGWSLESDNKKSTCNIL